MPTNTSSKHKPKPLSPRAKQAKQDRINNALKKYTEFPEYQEHLYQRVLGDVQTATGAIYALDEMISRLNVALHQAQGSRTGKISVRFTKSGGSQLKVQNRAPQPVVWFGGDGPTIYKKVDERLTRVKMHGLTINRRPTRKVLNHLQILLDKRAMIVEWLDNFSKAMKMVAPGITTVGVQTNDLLEEIPKMLEVDFTKVL